LIQLEIYLNGTKKIVSIELVSGKTHSDNGDKDDDGDDTDDGDEEELVRDLDVVQSLDDGGDEVKALVTLTILTKRCDDSIV
jgi:hypothetical protein